MAKKKHDMKNPNNSQLNQCLNQPGHVKKLVKILLWWHSRKKCWSWFFRVEANTCKCLIKIRHKRESVCIHVGWQKFAKRWPVSWKTPVDSPLAYSHTTIYRLFLLKRSNHEDGCLRLLHKVSKWQFCRHEPSIIFSLHPQDDEKAKWARWTHYWEGNYIWHFDFGFIWAEGQPGGIHVEANPLGRNRKLTCQQKNCHYWGHFCWLKAASQQRPTLHSDWLTPTSLTGPLCVTCILKSQIRQYRHGGGQPQVDKSKTPQFTCIFWIGCICITAALSANCDTCCADPDLRLLLEGPLSRPASLLPPPQ